MWVNASIAGTIRVEDLLVMAIGTFRSLPHINNKCLNSLSRPHGADTKPERPPIESGRLSTGGGLESQSVSRVWARVEIAINDWLEWPVRSLYEPLSPLQERLIRSPRGG